MHSIFYGVYSYGTASLDHSGRAWLQSHYW